MSGPVFVGFGDLMLRLETPGHERIVQAESFGARFTGAEANVAVMLAGFGLEARIASKVPDNAVGQACINYLRRYGVDTTAIARGGERLGLFFLETGASQRASTVVYDRGHTAFGEADRADFDWARILDGASWLHFSGTAPALGESVRASLREGLVAARAAGVTVSCDLNYRARLWSPDEARRGMEELAPYIDVLVGNEEDAAVVFGIKAEGSDVVQGELPLASYLQVAEQLMERFDFRAVATSLRTSVSASINRWAALVADRTGYAVSRTYEIHPIVDRVGGGDSFAAGLIYSMLQGENLQSCVDFAAAASCLKHSIPGDFNLVDIDEVRALVGGDASGRVRR